MRHHQPGYLEAKAVRILDHALTYVVRPDENGRPKVKEFPEVSWTADFSEVWHDLDAKRAWEILYVAYESAQRTRRIAVRLQRGY